LQCDRARGQRRTLVVVLRPVLLFGLVLALAACGSAPLPRAPLTHSDGGESNGWPLLGGGPSGTTLRFIERGRFQFGMTFRNRTKHVVTLLAVRTPQPEGALVHQERTRFVDFNPRPCTGGRSCPAVMFPLGGGGRAPFELAPGKQVGVTIGYRLGTCAQLRAGAAVANRGLFVDFRYGRGRVETQRFSLGYWRLHLRRPPASACDHRPHSQIAVTGEFATSSDWTIPWNGSASCTKTPQGRHECTGDDRCARGVFRSGVYQSPGKPAVRVEIDLRTRRVTAWVGIGLGGWTAFRSTYAVVTTTRSGRHELGGRFHATVAARRRGTFRVYGAWRCTTAA
jgi:hypothetical protein